VLRCRTFSVGVWLEDSCSIVNENFAETSLFKDQAVE
jgi:hypothetical protein